MKIQEAGKYTYGHDSFEHINLKGGEITIGNFCAIASGVKIYTGRGDHRKEFISTYPFGNIHTHVFPNGDAASLINTLDSWDVHIGHDVWIGQGVTIMPGVTIGSGSMIAARSHVVKSCEPYSIIGGNPSTLIKKRFTDTQIEELMKIEWWLWDDKKINDNIPYISSNNIDTFIELHKQSS